ncbi:MAG: DUF4157 domain-containing protein, partial [Waterburya sp.]
MGDSRVQVDGKSSSTLTPGFKPEESSFLKQRYQDRVEVETTSPTAEKQLSTSGQPTPTPPPSEPPPLSHSFGKVSVRPIQAKLTIGQPGDKYEQEADRVAEQVMRMPEPGTPAAAITRPIISPVVQRMCSECEEELQRQPMEEEEDKEEMVQAKPIAGLTTQFIQRQGVESEEEEEDALQMKPLANQITPLIQRQSEPSEEEDEETVQTKLVSHQVWSLVQRQAEATEEEGTKTIQTPGELTSGGAPLPTSLQKFYEPRMGYDLSSVRMHTGFDAKQRSADIQAHAFTYKNHIWLGHQQPLSPSFVLAHELAHVVQQNQPKRLASQGNDNSESQNRVETQSLQPLVQRNFYWAPGFTKPMTGPQLHNELTPAIADENSVNREIPVPNANREGNIGFDFKGQADFYKASQKIGIYFEKNKKSSDTCDDGELLGTPKRLQPRGIPFLRDQKITKIDQGPTEIALGELKPAARETVKFGVRQMGLYEDGIK